MVPDDFLLLYVLLFFKRTIPRPRPSATTRANWGPYLVAANQAKLPAYLSTIKEGAAQDRPSTFNGESSCRGTCLD